MRKLIFCAAMLAATNVFAADASLLSDRQIIKISGDMFRSYLDGDVNQMFSYESGCWKDASKARHIEKKKVAECAIAAASGMFIEASYAREQGRSPHPKYSPNIVRERILESSGLSTEDTNAVLESTFKPNVQVIVMGLSEAGMR